MTRNARPVTQQILGWNTSPDGANDVDVLDFTGMTFDCSVASIDLRSGNDTVVGSDDDDVIFGGTGDDNITGGDGDDELYGGAGDDDITGGAGDDRFSFTIAEVNSDGGNGSNQDTVADFTLGEDKIKLNWSVYVNAPASPPVIPGTGPSANGASSEIRYNDGGTDTTIYLPGTGGNVYRTIVLAGFSEDLGLCDFDLGTPIMV